MTWTTSRRQRPQQAQQQGGISRGVAGTSMLLT